MSVPKSTTLRRKVFDDWTRGWKLHWTSSDYSDPYITWENGSLMRGTPADERARLRDACLDEAMTVLADAGYLTARVTGCVRILGKRP